MVSVFSFEYFIAVYRKRENTYSKYIGQDDQNAKDLIILWLFTYVVNQ